MKFVENVSITFGTKILLIGMGIVSSIITARYLGPSGKGILATLGVITATATQFGNLGLQAANIHFVAREQQLLPRIAGNSVWTAAVIGGSISVGTFLLAAMFPGLLGNIPLLFLVIVLITIPFSFISMLLQSILLGLQRIKVFNLFDVIGKFSSLIIIAIVLILLRKGVFEVLIAGTCIAVLLSISYLIYLSGIHRFPLKLDRGLFANMFKYGFIFYINNILGFLVIKSDLLLVNYFRGSAAAGIYSINVQFGDLLYLLPSTVGLLLFPKLSAEVKSKSVKHTKRVARFMVVLMFVVCLLAAIVFRPLVGFMFGDKFLPAVLPMMFLIPGIFFLSIETVIVMYLASIGLPKFVPFSWVLAFALNIGLNIIWIPKYGISGAAISSTLAYTLVFGLLLGYFVKNTGSLVKDTLLIKPTELRSEVVDTLLSSLHFWRKDHE